MADVRDRWSLKKGSVKNITKQSLWRIDNRGIFWPIFIKKALVNYPKIKPEFLSPKVLQAYHTLSKNCQHYHAAGQRNTVLEEDSQKKKATHCNLLENIILHLYWFAMMENWNTTEGLLTR